MSDNVIVGLDIGTTKVCAVLGEINDEGSLEILGVGRAISTGLRRGVVVNIESTLKSVSEAIEAAELMSGREVFSCITGIAGAHIEGINSRGVVAVTGKGREITSSDIERVIEAARAVVIPMDREVLHVIPQTYIVDDQSGIRDPLDMIGVRLEAEVHIITGSVSSAQNLVKCVNRSGFKVDELVLQSLAASKAVLTQEEKELGCLLIDLGGGTSDVLVFCEGAPYYSTVIPVGGTQVTNDISITLNMSADTSEKIKLEDGCCFGPMIESNEEIILPGLAGRPPRVITRFELCSIMQARMEETFLLIKDKIEKNGYLRLLNGGIVLTGGGANMNGVCELASQVFGISARVGFPLSQGGLVEEYKKTEYATAVGLVLVGSEGMKVTNTISSKKSESGKEATVVGKVIDWFKKEFF